MKIFTLSIGLFLVILGARATNYYSQPSGSPNLLTSWNTMRDGSGTAPASFTLADDVFLIQDGHTMITTADWTIGSSSSSLVIEVNGVLQGDHAILLSGIFRIFNGGHYIHNNTASVSTSAGASVFGGSSIFSANATVTISKWINANTPLPAGIDWPNLIIDYAASLGSWNQQGNLALVKGNLIINHTGGAGEEFQLTATQDLALDIQGSLTANGGILRVKSDGSSGVAAVNVTGGINVNTATIALGDVNIAPNLELRFMGDLTIADGTISSSTADGFLVANGTVSQSIASNTALETSFRVAPLAIAALAGDIIFGVEKNLVIGGTVNASTHTITFGADGKLLVAGGELNAGGNINMRQGVCAVCRGDGSYNPANDIPWCVTTGSFGKLNFSDGVMLFDKSVGSTFLAGAQGSTGEVYLTNAKLSFTNGAGSSNGSVELSDNSILDLDETSLIEGFANYSGNGGSLIIGDPSGINTSGAEGNIIVSGARSFNNTGINNFEYKGSFDQSTGNGLPLTVLGALTVNNTGSATVQLTRSTVIANGGSLHLLNGKLLTSASTLLTLQQGAASTGGSASAYIDGPIVKQGNDNFTFPVGKLGKFSPLAMERTGSDADDLVTDVFRAEYFPGNPKLLIGPNLGPGLDRVSEIEYWSLTRANGNASKKVTFSFYPSSAVANPSSLVVSFFDGSLWLNAGNDGTTGSPTTGTIAKALDNFGFFTFGSIDASNTLPVKLISFTARKQSQKGTLRWEIDEAQDAAYFEVLSSTDNRNYSAIAKISAEDNRRMYEYSDQPVAEGLVYYRLRITEKNGGVFHSRIAPLLFGSGGLKLVSVSPSISAGAVSLTVVSPAKANVSFSVVNGDGKLIQSFTRLVEEGLTVIQLHTEGWAAGLYYISAFGANGRSNSVRLMKR